MSGALERKDDANQLSDEEKALGIAVARIIGIRVVSGLAVLVALGSPELAGSETDAVLATAPVKFFASFRKILTTEANKAKLAQLATSGALSFLAADKLQNLRDAVPEQLILSRFEIMRVYQLVRSIHLVSGIRPKLNLAELREMRGAASVVFIRMAEEQKAESLAAASDAALATASAAAADRVPAAALLSVSAAPSNIVVGCAPGGAAFTPAADPATAPGPGSAHTQFSM